MGAVIGASALPTSSESWPHSGSVILLEIDATILQIDKSHTKKQPFGVLVDV